MPPTLTPARNVPRFWAADLPRSYVRCQQDRAKPQWLSEVVMARTEDWFGLAGVAWLSGLLEVLVFLGVYAACRVRAEPLVAMPVTALALYAMQSGLSMRPQVVSYMLAAVEEEIA